MKNDYSHYLNTQENFRQKWHEYFECPANFSSDHYVEQLAPLFGTDDFFKLTEAQRNQLNLEYIKLVAEALIFFEQLLVLGAWKIINKRTYLEAHTKRALQHFAYEELYHSHGFRHFLFIHENMHWNKNKIYADSKILRFIISKIVILAPGCVFLPGAKLEAFTLSYHKMIKKYYLNQRSNSWIHLNHIHQLDEAHHVPLEFELHNEIVKNEGVLKTFFGCIFFVLTMQLALGIGAFKVVKYALPEKNLFTRIRLMMKMARWAVRLTPAYNEAREMTRKQFIAKKPIYGNLFKFVYW